MKDTEGNLDMYKVAIVITTYNLEKYIKKAIQSVLSQKTRFDYRIIIADDASTDGTISILKEYQNKYPKKITVLYSDINRGSLANSNRALSYIDCEYFSFLDGDDYWIGEDRLQKQVDFLDANPNYMMYAGNTLYLRNNKVAELVVPPKKMNRSYFMDDYLNNKMPFFHTSSILLRNTIFKNGLLSCYTDAVGTFEECALRGEDFRRILHLTQGPLYASKDIISCYRIHCEGIWQGSSSTHKLIESAISSNFYKKYFGFQYGDYFTKAAENSYKNLIRNLILDNKLLKDYLLDSKDTYLLTSYLRDISKYQSTYEIKNSKGKKILKRILLKLITEL